MYSVNKCQRRGGGNARVERTRQLRGCHRTVLACDLPCFDTVGRGQRMLRDDCLGEELFPLMHWSLTAEFGTIYRWFTSSDFDPDGPWSSSYLA